MTKIPCISIIIPIYKVEQYLVQCLESVIKQTWKNLEIILVDDGSPDQCGTICDVYAQKDERVRVIHKPNGGLSDARNVGLDIATGDYIGFVDSDDYIDESMFEYLLSGIEKTDADISICNVTHFSSNRTWTDSLDPCFISGTEGVRNLFLDFSYHNFVWNKLYAARLWKNVRFPKGRTFEDILTTWQTFRQADRIIVLPDAKYFYRHREDGISHNLSYTALKSRCLAWCDLYREAIKYYPQFGPELLFWLTGSDTLSQIYEMIVDEKDSTFFELIEYISGFLQEIMPNIRACSSFTLLDKVCLEMVSCGTISSVRAFLFLRKTIYHPLDVALFRHKAARTVSLIQTDLEIISQYKTIKNIRENLFFLCIQMYWISLSTFHQEDESINIITSFLKEKTKDFTNPEAVGHYGRILVRLLAQPNWSSWYLAGIIYRMINFFYKAFVQKK